MSTQSYIKHSGHRFHCIVVNDLLRRKEQSHLGDISVTKVNNNLGAVWSCMDQVNLSAVD
ncbi:hypothetical protein NHX12_032848, partial [Muraenolepis orangiensis]